MNTLTTVFTQFTDQALTLLIWVSVGILLTIIGFWVYYKRRFQQLNHQIPAMVVKNYLDSIIQNSNALKSSLLRGDDPLGIAASIPSVVPVTELPKGGVEASGISEEEYNAKVAEIAKMAIELEDKNLTIEELQKKLEQALASDGDAKSAMLETENKDLKAKVSELEKQLEGAKANAGGGDSSAELATLQTERDELKDRLSEYEIIEEDLANLKRLQVENEQLKQQLSAGGGAPAAEAPAAEATAEAAPEEEAPAPEPQAEAENIVADDSNLNAPPAEEGNQKSAEELLSEFEKMLG